MALLDHGKGVGSDVSGEPAGVLLCEAIDPLCELLVA